jgi:hypothetical protein
MHARCAGQRREPKCDCGGGCEGSGWACGFGDSICSAPPRLVGRQAWVRVLEGTLEIEVDGATVAAHPVGAGRFGRHILPEHEAEFRATSTSRHVLTARFLGLGSAAERFIEGLRHEHGTGGGVVVLAANGGANLPCT